VPRRALQRLKKDMQEEGSGGGEASVDVQPVMDTAPLQISPTTPFDRCGICMFLCACFFGSRVSVC
jgi:hypothetical protein